MLVNELFKLRKIRWFHEHSKHIELDCHFIRDKIQDGTVSTHFIASKDQLADLLTKSFSKQQHEVLQHKYGVKDIFRYNRKDEESS